MSDDWEPKPECNCDREERDPQDMSGYEWWICPECGVKVHIPPDHMVEGLVYLQCPQDGAMVVPLAPEGLDVYGTMVLYQRGWEGCHNPRGW